MRSSFVKIASLIIMGVSAKNSNPKTTTTETETNGQDTVDSTKTVESSTSSANSIYGLLVASVLLLSGLTM